VANSLKVAFPEAVVIARDEVLKWARSNRKLIDLHKEINTCDGSVEIFNALGIIDPSESTTLLNEVNVELPIHLAEKIQDSNVKLVTFGTIMENFPSLCSQNNYLKSKLDFKKYIDKQNNSKHVLHFQLHTLYGGVKIQESMFIGQIYKAIKTQQEFVMSSGKQIREYHHITDDILAIQLFVDANLSGIQQINSGKPTRLKDLAEHVFNHFDSAKLLRINNQLDKEPELHSYSYQKVNCFDNMWFRDPIPGIIEWLEEKNIRNELE